MHQQSFPSRGAAALRWIFIIGMLAFCLFLAWHTWTVYGLRFQVEDLAVTLETNSQRVLKQQYEYDQAAAAIPETQAELALVQPESDAIVQAVDELKEERQQLRQQRDDLALELAAAQSAADQAQADLALARQTQQSLTQEVEQLRLEEERLAQELAVLQQQLEP